MPVAGRMPRHALRRSRKEIAPGTLAFVARIVQEHDERYRVEKHTPALVLGRAWEPLEPMVSSVCYAVLLGMPHQRLDILPHCDLLVAAG